MSGRDRYHPKPQPDKDCVPFGSAEEAWFWFIQAQQARNDGARIVAGISRIVRPCEPVDILAIVERLYRNRRLLMDHILVLRAYGRRLLPPDPRRPKEMRARTLWDEALEVMEESFRRKGIIGGPVVSQPDYIAQELRSH